MCLSERTNSETDRKSPLRNCFKAVCFNVFVRTVRDTPTRRKRPLVVLRRIFLYVYVEVRRMRLRDVRLRLKEPSLRKFVRSAGLLIVLHTHNQLYKHICMRNHNDERHSLLEKIYLSLIESVVCERELETEQNCNILTPTLMTISISFQFSRLLNRRPGGPALCRVPFFLQHHFSNSSDPPKLLEFPVHWVI